MTFCSGTAVPQHSLVLLMPHLNSFLPLILIQLVLLQNPGFISKEDTPVRIHMKETEIKLNFV